jgi:hypothetical protein
MQSSWSALSSSSSLRCPPAYSSARQNLHGGEPSERGPLFKPSVGWGHGQENDDDELKVDDGDPVVERPTRVSSWPEEAGDKAADATPLPPPPPPPPLLPLLHPHSTHH